MSKEYLNKLCDITKSNDEILKCARNIDAKKLVIDYYNLKYFMVIDNNVFKKPTGKLLEEKAFKKCSILTGFNSDEYGLYMTYNIHQILGKNPATWDQDAKSFSKEKFSKFMNEIHPKEIAADSNFYEKLIQEYFSSRDLKNLNSNPSSINFYKYMSSIETDYVFSCAAFKLVEAFSKSNLNTYFYKYGFRIPSSAFRESLASAVHGDDLSIIFAGPLANKVSITFIFHIFK
jgi:carboxylesterase type B